MKTKPVMPDVVTPEADAYEAPRVERVLTSDDLAREVQYAGGASTDLQVDGSGD